MQPDNGVPLSPYTGVPGWEEDIEEEVLIGLASKVPEHGQIVEIGAEYGRSAAALLRGSDSSVAVTSIDLFPTDHPVVGDLFAAYWNNLEEAGFAPRDAIATWRWQKLRMSSHEAVAYWANWDKGTEKPRVIDLLFIDGDHTYQGVVQDIEDWTPRVKPGGIVAFHDCAHGNEPHALHLEVARAVDEWAAREAWEYLGQWASLRVYRRKHDGL